MSKILVLMSTYNGEKYVADQIKSILGQRDCEVDILVRDDGSKDRTCEIVRAFEKTGRVKLIVEGKNLKPAQSFLRLLKISPSYEYYAFADQDDIWDSNKLYKGIRSIDKLCVPAVYCSNARIVDDKLRYNNQKVYKEKKFTNFESVIINGNYMGCTMVFNHKLKEQITKSKSPNYCIMHDYYVTAICSSIGGKVIYDNCAYMSYRIHGKNTVGVSTRFIDKVTSKISSIFSRNGEISRQCESILEVMEDSIGVKEKEFLYLVSQCRKSKISRVKLLKNKNIYYENKNKQIIMMFFILSGKI